MTCYICHLEYTNLVQITAPKEKGKRRIYWKVCHGCVNKMVNALDEHYMIREYMKNWHQEGQVH